MDGEKAVLSEPEIVSFLVPDGAPPSNDIALYIDNNKVTDSPEVSVLLIVLNNITDHILHNNFPKSSKAIRGSYYYL